MKMKGNIICRIIYTEEIANGNCFSPFYYFVVRFETTQLSSKSSCSFQDTFSVKRCGLEITSHETFFISTPYSQPRNQVGSLFFSQISVSLGFLFTQESIYFTFLSLTPFLKGSIPLKTCWSTFKLLIPKQKNSSIFN